MTSVEIISNDYYNFMNNKIYEMISLTSFYYNDMDWSLHNIKYYYKNIKLIILINFIMFFDFIFYVMVFMLCILFLYYSFYLYL